MSGFMRNRAMLLLILLLLPGFALAQKQLPKDRGRVMERIRQFPETKPLRGEIAPDFTLKTLDGGEFTLSESYAKQPVVIEFGSFT